MTYAEAARQIANNYRQRVRNYEQAELDLFASCAEFAESERKKRDLLLKQAKGAKVASNVLDEVLAQNEQIRQKLHLVAPAPHCKICGDTGRANGKYCECAVALALRSQAGEIGIPLHTFEDTDFSVYGNQTDTYKKLFSYVQTICTKYPANKKRCLVIGGTTGTGKTYLAGCAAQKILERGMSVTALTAFAANRCFLKYHTTFDEKKTSYLDPLLDCSLLVIDDLGTESLLKNVSIEYLYQVINERNTTGKLTLITTNLTPDKLLSRYGERIYSRIFDKSLSYAIFLKADDLRKSF